MPSDNVTDRRSTTAVPLPLAKQADARALAIFKAQQHFDRTFAEMLGEIYMVGLMAGLEANTHAR